jgi:hypothetical protein
MSLLERFDVPGFTELPKCRCGGEMHIASVDPLPERNDTYVRVYDCPACQHEMWLTVWGTDALN